MNEIEYLKNLIRRIIRAEAEAEAEGTPWYPDEVDLYGLQLALEEARDKVMQQALAAKYPDGFASWTEYVELRRPA